MDKKQVQGTATKLDPIILLLKIISGLERAFPPLEALCRGWLVFLPRIRVNEEFGTPQNFAV